MAKITLNDVGSLISSTTAVTTINDNSAAIEAAFENTLSRDGTTPNQMGADLDMNSHDILNVNTIKLKDKELAYFPTPSVQGSLLYKDTEEWKLLPPGVNGQFLETKGPSANPIWGDIAGGGDMLRSMYDPTSVRADAFNSSNTKFLQKDTGAVEQSVRDSLSEHLSVTQFKLSSELDWTNAFQRAYDAAVARGGDIIWIPDGSYELSAFPATGNNIIWQGSGRGCKLISTSTTGDFVTFSSVNSWIRDVTLTTNVRKTSGYMLVFGPGNVAGAIGVYIDYGYNGISVLSGSETTFERVDCLNLLGDFGVYVKGTSESPIFGTTFSNMTIAGSGVNFPTAAGDKGVWTASTAYSVGDAVQSSGYFYICTTAGTSSASTGPSGYPSTGTTPESVYTNTITDGTVQWKFVNKCISLFVVDSWAYSTRLLGSIKLLLGYNGFIMQDIDAANDSASIPKWIHSFHDVECDTCWNVGCALIAGGGFHASDSWFGSTVNGHGVFIGPDFLGDVSIINSRVNNNFLSGIVISSGPTNILINNNFIGVNSSDGAGINAGILVGNSVTGFEICGNRIGPLPSLSSNANQKGIILGNGCDDFIIKNNDLRGNNVNFQVGTLPLTPGETFWIKDNLGLKTKMNGFVILEAASTTTTVTHGLASTPRINDIQITPGGGWGASTQFYPNSGTITSSTFEIGTAANPGANVAMNVRAGIWGDW